MKIVILQLAAELGQFEINVQKAEELLQSLRADEVDLLVLPELAFSGYNFDSLQAISPHLEPTAAGRTTVWAKQTAKRLDCIVTVGYPEINSARRNDSADLQNGRSEARSEDDEEIPNFTRRYNATVTVSSSGEILANYRKTFLYYTDETWAEEGQGFYAGSFPLSPPLPTRDSGGSRTVGCRVAHGICMDINPYKFTAPWEDYEFTNHVLKHDADLIVMSNAWLTAPPSATAVPEEDGDGDEESAKQPHLHTISYWLERFRPLIDRDREVVAVCANRTGSEGTAKYAGSSTMMKLGKGQAALWGVLGRDEEGLLKVDTDREPPLRLVRDSK